MEKNDTKEKDNSRKLPDQRELEKELSEYLSKKYGDRVKIISPFLVPKGQEISIDEGDIKDKCGPVPSFDMLPVELEAYLDSFIVKQAQAKAVLGTKICTHFNRSLIKIFKISLWTFSSPT